MYEVIRKAGSYAIAHVPAKDIPTHVPDVTGLLPGDQDYKVIGQNSRGNVPESEVATISVADDPLVQPTGLTLQVGPMNSLIANRIAVPSATHYDVEKQLIGSDPSFVVVG